MPLLEPEYYFWFLHSGELGAADISVSLWVKRGILTVWGRPSSETTRFPLESIILGLLYHQSLSVTCQHELNSNKGKLCSSPLWLCAWISWLESIDGLLCSGWTHSFLHLSRPGEIGLDEVFDIGVFGQVKREVILQPFELPLLFTKTTVGLKYCMFFDPISCFSS